jgi:8-oxo-dGTP pyrophosphatase MutT (NUDIX family)
MHASPRCAATLVLVRDGVAGLEVLTMRRTDRATFMPGAQVFPGGALESGDSDDPVLARVVGLDGEFANTRLGVPSGGSAYWVAAIRECFEEAGILLALDEHGAPVASERVAALAHDRSALQSGKLSFAAWLAQERLRLAASELVYFDHWITPPDRSRRFDTRFFMARAPAGQEASHDDNELVHSAWLQPTEALARAKRNEILLPTATRTILQELAGVLTAAEAVAMAAAKTNIGTNR